MSGQTVLTTLEAAAASGLSANAIKRACWQGRLKARKAGRDWLILQADLSAWLADAAAHKPGRKK